MLALIPAPDCSWPLPPDRLTLPRDEVHVWRAFLDQSLSHVEAFWHLLATDEKRRAERYCFVKDRNQFIIGRGLLRVLLGRYLDKEPAQLRFCYNAYGKPALADTPLPPNLCFNVTHSHGLVLYAMAYDRAIGIDVEYVRTDLTGEQLARQFFSWREIEALRTVAAPRRLNAFFNGWTRKEAFVKATGRGLSTALDQFEVSLTPDKPAALLSVNDDSQAAASWSLQALTPGRNYVAALAVKGHNWRLRHWCWEPTAFAANSS